MTQHALLAALFCPDNLSARDVLQARSQLAHLLCQPCQLVITFKTMVLLNSTVAPGHARRVTKLACRQTICTAPQQDSRSTIYSVKDKPYDTTYATGATATANETGSTFGRHGTSLVLKAAALCCDKH
jgi:hypothetical protein